MSGRVKRIRMNRRLRLEAPQRVSDGAGGFSETWVELGKLWAEVRAMSGRELSQSGVLLSAQRYQIRLRAAPEGSSGRPRAEQRFRDGSRLFRITAVAEDDSDGRILICRATEETAI